MPVSFAMAFPGCHIARRMETFLSKSIAAQLCIGRQALHGETSEGSHTFWERGGLRCDARSWIAQRLGCRVLRVKTQRSTVLLPTEDAINILLGKYPDHVPRGEPLGIEISRRQGAALITMRFL